MKIDTGRDDPLHQLGELIAGIEVAMLTTRAEDGSLVSRPLQTLKLNAEGELVFFTGADSDKIQELREAGDVNLAYADPGENRYVSVRGRSRLDRDRDTINELWSAAQKVFFPAGKDDPNLMVLRVQVRDASWWESNDNFIRRALDFSRGMLSDEAQDLGEHGHLTPGER